ncbi:MAG TPA: FAD-dependent oxidoreductase [Acidimicrobiia bacterium]|nr:FAD-dependent oxidoreductase [Acidimicrobiia bacterium]
MARIVMVGAGVVGMSTAMLLARDGHDVTVLERDDAPPPDVPDDAWTSWTRRGVNQFRLLHFFLPRFRALVDEELPEVVDAAERLGALRYNPVLLAPAELTGGPRTGDDAYTSVTGRRPVMEAAVASVALRTPGLTIRRGVAVAGLETGTSTTPGVPHVTGVRTDTGEILDADLVVDMTGRRSALPGWLDAIGARPVDEEVEDSGFVYYGRHFRSADGSVPPALGGLLQHYGSVSLLTLPADNGTWGVGFITSARDAQLRALRDVDRWSAALKAFPLVAHWADGAPLDDSVAVMAKIEDRHRNLCIDGTPVATGVVAVADSWACTNPSLGRGISIGFLHGRALRDLLRSQPLDDPLELARAWHATTEETVEPWYRSTLAFDRHRLAEIDAAVEGVPYEPGDPEWELTHALEAAALHDGDVLRAFLSIASLVSLPDEAIARPGVLDKAIELGSGWRDEPLPGPDRPTLLATIAG